MTPTRRPEAPRPPLQPYVYHRWDVLDGHVYAAACGCGWQSQPAHNYQLAKIRSQSHRHTPSGEGEQQ